MNVTDAERLTARVDLIRIAADLFNDVTRPDAASIVNMAKTFEAYALGTAQASGDKRKPKG